MTLPRWLVASLLSVSVLAAGTLVGFFAWETWRRHQASRELLVQLKSIPHREEIFIGDNGIVSTLFGQMNIPYEPLKCTDLDSGIAKVKQLDALDSVFPRLIELLRDKDDRIRSRAAYALGRIPCRTASDEAEITAAIVTATHDESPLVKYHAAFALQKLGAVSELIAALHDQDRLPYVFAALNQEDVTLPEAQAGVVISSLINMLDDNEPKMRLAAAMILSSFHIQAYYAVPKLIESLRDGDYRVRDAAAHALGRMGPAGEPAIRALSDLLLDEQAAKTARSSLVSIGYASIPVLAEAIEHKAPSVRSHVRWALTQLGSQAIASYLNNSEGGAQTQVAYALATIEPDDPLGVATLAKLIQSEVLDTRREAALKLARLSENPTYLARLKVAVPSLTAATQDEDWRVRSIATVILRQVDPDSIATKSRSGP